MRKCKTRGNLSCALNQTIPLSKAMHLILSRPLFPSSLGSCLKSNDRKSCEDAGALGSSAHKGFCQETYLLLFSKSCFISAQRVSISLESCNTGWKTPLPLQSATFEKPSDLIKGYTPLPVFLRHFEGTEQCLSCSAWSGL